MKFGKGPSGIIGSTTKPRTLQIRAKSQHACTHVLSNPSNLRNKDEPAKTTHKEESKGRIAADEIDRQKLREFINSCIHPLEPGLHDSSVLFNIYSGETGGDKCNVNKSVEISIAQMKEFQQGLPNGFRDTISKLVITMKKGGKKQRKKEEIIEPHNTELIFAILNVSEAAMLDSTIR